MRFFFKRSGKGNGIPLIIAGKAHQHVRRKLPDLHRRQVFLPHMDAIGICKQGYIQTVIHDKQGACFAGFFTKVACLFQKYRILAVLVPKLHDPRPSGQNPIQPLTISSALRQFFAAHRIECNLLCELFNQPRIFSAIIHFLFPFAALYRAPISKSATVRFIPQDLISGIIRPGRRSFLNLTKKKN